MKIFSATYDPVDKRYYLYDGEAHRIVPSGERVKYSFSFRDDYESPHAIAWSELIESLELEDKFEFFYQSSVAESRIRAIDRGLISFWLERGTERNMKSMVTWSRTTLLDENREKEGHSVLKTEDAAFTSMNHIFTRYISLVKRRDLLNYGHYWPNWERSKLLELRIGGMSFRNIGEQLKRTEHAARSEYGRLRRGEDNVTIELEECEFLRGALPLGKIPAKVEVVVVESAE